MVVSVLTDSELKFKVGSFTQNIPKIKLPCDLVPFIISCVSVFSAGQGVYVLKYLLESLSYLQSHSWQLRQVY